MQFAYPHLRYSLVLAFVVAALAVVALVRKRRVLFRLARQGIHQPGMLVRPSVQILKCAMLSFAAVLLGIAVLGPQWGWTEEEIPLRSGRDVLIVLDVSRSMLAEDVAPNRLQRAKADLRDLAGFLERAGGYRIGLIAFAERAAVMCPLTSDYRCFVEELADASLKSLRLRGHADWGDGTQIRLALERANQTIDDANAAYTDVLLVSDGEDMTHETLEMATSLARRGIAVHTYGLGDSTNGALIPVRDSLGRPAHLRYRGEPVYTHLQETVLRAIAETTHGHYFVAGTSYRDLDRQFGELLAAKESLERQNVQHQRRGIHRYAWFVVPALLLLLLQGLLSDAHRPGRAVPEPTHYFSWVRHRQNPSLKRKRRNVSLRLRFRLGIGLFFFCVLCDSVVRSVPTEDSWAAFHRGNELLRQAQQAGLNADPAKLLQAQRQYQACLSHQRAADTGTLLENARHNLEMTKLLLMQVSSSGANDDKPDQKEPPQTPGHESSVATARSDSSSGASDPKQRQKSDGGEGKPLPSHQRPKEEKRTAVERNKTNALKDKEKDQSSSGQRQQQQSQEKTGSCPNCLTGQNQSDSARRMKEGNRGSQSGKDAQSSSRQNPKNQSEEAQSANDANSLHGQKPGSVPSDALGQDQRPGRSRISNPEPDAKGLFHAEMPGVNRNPSRSERRSQGKSPGIEPGKEKMVPTMDPAHKAAVLRLQGAIQRIEKRRTRSENGHESGPEDPANQNRYRDW